MIVVAGGSGLLGRHVVSELVSSGETVRVLVRDVARARAALGADIEIIAHDVRRTDGLDEFVAGASVVISAVHGFLGGHGAGPAAVDDRGNAHLVEAAGAAGAHFILVSVLGAAPNSPIDLFRAKHKAEQHLRRSAVPWTIVRPAAYLETWLSILTKTAGKSGRPLIFGRGEQLIQFVSALDVAAVVSRAAIDPALRGQVVEVAGAPLSMNDLAQALQSARGWSGAPRHLPRALLGGLSVLARPISPALARQNRTALAMDTGQLTDAALPTGPVGTPQCTLPDVLARFTAT